MEASWITGDGSAGRGQALALTSDSGLFWFFEEDNIELLVKVLDGCGVNGAYWVFTAGTTDVGVNLQVTDTLTGLTWQQNHLNGSTYLPALDTAAFPICPVH